jgi:hypothetical protein
MNPESMSGPRMQRPARPSSVTPQLVFGVFRGALGRLLMLARLEIFAMAARLLRFWPVGVMVLGVSILARRDDAHGRFWGFFWIVVGGWLLLNTLGLVRVGIWELFWPVLLIVIGVNLIRQTMRRGRGGAPAGGAVAGNLFAVLSESKHTARSAEPFRGASLTAIMGGCVLDLRQATLAPGEEAVVDVFALMAGHEIVVPTTWTVVPEVVNVMGGVEDKRLPAPVDPPAANAAPPRLVVRGFIMMAGLTFKT